MSSTKQGKELYKEAISIQQAMEMPEGSEVVIRGWVHRERGSNKLKFIILRDSSNRIQCVFERKEIGDKKFEIIDKVHVETSMAIKGTIKKDERAPTGYEIHATDFEIVGESNNYPITKDQSPEFLADMRHLWLRSTKMQSILKIRSTIFTAIREFFLERGFYEYHSPMFQPTQAEGGSTVFEVPYFGDKVYLAQTWQLQAEPAVASLEKIFTIAPSFRAEKSKTSRHLTEYWHAEMEYAWGDFDELQDYAEQLLKHIIKRVLEKNTHELELLGRDIEKLKPTIEKPFPRITYDEALKILEKEGMKIEWGKDLRTIEEDKISELFDTPVIITRYPKEVKAFYMKEDPENPKVVLGFDVIAPEHYGEIIGASQREEDIEILKKKLIEQGEDPKEYEFYLDTRRYGSVPHAGFGLGTERVIAWVCGLTTVKDAIPFPRTMLRYRP